MMKFSIDLIEFDSFSLFIQNSGAFDQDVLASPVWALARIALCLGRLSTQSNSYRAPIKEKVCVWAHYLMQNRCERENPYGRSGH